MSYAIPSMTRVPATEKGLTIGDFLVPVRVGERTSPGSGTSLLIVAGALLIYLCALVSFKIPGNPVPYHAPELRRPRRRRGARAPARRRGGAAVRALGVVGLPFFAEGKGGLAGDLGRDRRLSHRVRRRGRARRAARRAGLGPQDRRRDRRDGLGNAVIYAIGVPVARGRDGLSPRRGDRVGLLPFLVGRHRQARSPRPRVPGGVVGGRPAAQRPLTAPPCPGARGRDGLYGPRLREAWRYNREATLLLGAGPAGAAAPGRPSARRRGRRPALRLPRRPVGAPGRDAPLVPADRVRDAGRGAGRDPRLNRLHRPRHRPGHRSGRGRRPRRRYRALDPALSLWVHATLIDSLLVANDRWATPLPPATASASTRRRGRSAGRSACPETCCRADIDAFDAYVAAMLAPEGPVHPSPIARELAPSILQPPLEGVVGGRVEALLGPAAPPFVGVPRRRATAGGRRAAAAGRRAAAGADARGVRAALGIGRAGDRRVARDGVAVLDAPPADVAALVPAGARGRCEGRARAERVVS